MNTDSSHSPRPVIVYGTGAGTSAFDADAQGGNPFASALLSQMQINGLPLSRLLLATRAATRRATRSRQTPSWQALGPASSWQINPRGDTALEHREALILVVHDYEAPGWNTLAGAAFDQRRLAVGLAGLGFNVTQRIPPGRADLLRSLRAFASRSRRAGVGLIYCTGHGLEHRGKTFLLPGDYPGTTLGTLNRLGRHALCIDRIAASSQARMHNVVFFAGCRNHAHDA